MPTGKGSGTVFKAKLSRGKFAKAGKWSKGQLAKAMGQFLKLNRVEADKLGQRGSF